MLFGNTVPANMLKPEHSLRKEAHLTQTIRYTVGTFNSEIDATQLSVTISPLMADSIGPIEPLPLPPR